MYYDDYFSYSPYKLSDEDDSQIQVSSSIPYTSTFTCNENSNKIDDIIHEDIINTVGYDSDIHSRENFYIESYGITHYYEYEGSLILPDYWAVHPVSNVCQPYSLVENSIYVSNINAIITWTYDPNANQSPSLLQTALTYSKFNNVWYSTSIPNKYQHFI